MDYPALGRRRLVLLAAQAAIGLVLALVLIRATAPGGITYDTSFQLRQATEEVGFNDWHPVIMALVWKALIAITGSVGSMAVVQVLLAWLGAVLTCYWLLVTLAKPAWSWAGLSLLVLPFTVNILGTVWKDTQMAIALYLCIVLLLIATVRPRRALWLLSAAALFLLYAVLVRKNALVVAVPLVAVVCFLWARARNGAAWFGRWILASGVSLVVFVGLVFGVGAVISSATHATKNSQFTQVMLDDLIFAVPESAIVKSSAIDDELRQHLLEARDQCEKDGAIWDAYWRCYGKGEKGDFTGIAKAEQIQAIWLQEIPRHLGSYLDYRAQTFSAFLNTSTLQLAGTQEFEGLDIHQEHPRLFQALKYYVVDFAFQQAGWLFHGMTWLVFSVIGLGVALRKRQRDWIAAAVFAAGLLYLATYLPSAPAANYRYVFPAVLTTLLGWAAVLAGRYGRGAERATAPEAESTPAAEAETGSQSPA